MRQHALGTAVALAELETYEGKIPTMTKGLRPLDRSEAALAKEIVKLYDLPEDSAKLAVVELKEQARRLELRMSRLHPWEDILSEMYQVVLDKNHPVMRSWKREKGTIQVLVTTTVFRSMTETAGPVKVPMVRHGRDSDAVKQQKRMACTVPCSLDVLEMEKFANDEAVSDFPQPLKEYIVEQIRKQTEDMLDLLRVCLPILFFRDERHADGKLKRAAEWPLHRRMQKAEKRRAAGLPPIAYRKIEALHYSTERRERSIRAGFRLWTLRSGKEVPEHVIDAAVDKVKRWR